MEVSVTNIYDNILSYKMWLAPFQSPFLLTDRYPLTESQSKLKLDLGFVRTHHHYHGMVHVFVWHKIRTWVLLRSYTTIGEIRGSKSSTEQKE
jgi:hypothetical protein